jgi:hypothetical protein
VAACTPEGTNTADETRPAISAVRATRIVVLRIGRKPFVGIEHRKITQLIVRIPNANVQVRTCDVDREAPFPAQFSADDGNEFAM